MIVVWLFYLLLAGRPVDVSVEVHVPPRTAEVFQRHAKHLDKTTSHQHISI